MDNNLLNIRNLKVSFQSNDNELFRAVDDVSISVNEGETVGIVGESGSGKSVTSLTTMGLNKDGITEGEIIYKNQDLLKLSPNKMRKFRGNEMAMIFQEPMTSLNPVFTVGNQLIEALKVHTGRKDVKKTAINLLAQVGIPRPEKILNEYPHKLSGGMRQRVLIAIAISNNPSLLIADEPTTALDVTIQAEILELITDLKEKNNMAMLLITHDLGVVAETCDRVYVMYNGKVVGEGSIFDIFDSPKHPYTQGLIKSIPTTDEEDDRKRLYAIKGNVPAPEEKLQGCHFASRCEFVMEVCKNKMPRLEKTSAGHSNRCWLHQEYTEKEGDYETTVIRN